MTVIRFCDTPNVHRFLEICIDWLLAVGYDIVHLAKFLFEKALHFLKACSQFVTGDQCAVDFAIKHFFNDDTLRRIALSYKKSRTGHGRV